MHIVCPNCATSYRIAPEHLGETGRAVRCVTCHTLWFEQPRTLAEQDTAAVGPEGIDPSLIRPPLNDVFDVGEARLAASADGRDDDTGEDTAPSIVPDADPSLERNQIDVPRNIERAATTRKPKGRPITQRLQLSRHTLPAAICALVLVIFCLIAARQQVVRFLPQTASLYAAIGLPVNLRGLAFENIKVVREIQDGVPTLVVEGDIIGTTSRHTEVPRLRFAVTDRNGKEIYAWTARPARTLLPPGETLPFRSRLASPPAEANDVTVRFFNRRDAQAGLL
ncbi:MJ0042-type zinc finger domain-containing protein [Pseudorhodoplanes sp.]|uniref:MJ0042-type zinc finger domain-containing protein n=1 Tax=Pseudorhodoplanes sp. TaxID=1934341 RepID=UPI002C6DAEF5|nr:MJ0042-type zinc finger domain-containing protein [Pseudorhodoplanes sp.]HWV51413.1 MJ0042-type zinc finger domain-containing protein [Pseudorhodoplanes sp.]